MCVCKSFVLLVCSLFLSGGLVLHSNNANADSDDSRTTTAASLDEEILRLLKDGMCGGEQE